MTDQVITIPSYRHGDRTFQCIGFQPYERRNGTKTILAKWQGACVRCGRPFEVWAPLGATTIKESHSFAKVMCWTCRHGQSAPP
jgi:hypothetical protein